MINQKFINLLVVIVTIFLFSLPVSAIGQTNPNFSGSGAGSSIFSGSGGAGQLCNPLGGCTANGPNDLVQFINLVLDAVVKIGAVVVVFFVIYSGFLLVTAQGNETKLKTAKDALLWTLVGAAILLGAKLLAGVISTTIANLSK